MKVRNIKDYCLLFIGIILLGVGGVIFGFDADTSVNASSENFVFENKEFHKCVVDSYNEQNGTNLDVNTSLSDTQLKDITILSCDLDKSGNYNHNLIDSVNGIEKLTSLVSLYLDTPNLVNIDLSNNSSLKYLKISNSSLTNLNVAQNQLLEELYLNNHILTHIDLSNNINLKKLGIYNGKLESIDISKNTLLESLWLWNNNLSNINLSQNTALKNLYLEQNNLSNIDISKNVLLKELMLENNNLVSIDLSQNKDLIVVNVDYNVNLLNYNGPVANSNFKDNNLYACVVNAYNQENNATISVTTKLDDSQLESIKALTCQNMGISDVSGLEKLTSLEELSLVNNNISAIDLSQNNKLKTLSLAENNIDKINLGNNIELQNLNLSNNLLSNIDLNSNSNLKIINLVNNSLVNIDISNNNNLIELYLTTDGVNNINAEEVSGIKIIRNYTSSIDNNKVISQITQNEIAVGDIEQSNTQMNSIDITNKSELLQQNPNTGIVISSLGLLLIIISSMSILRKKNLFKKI